MVFQCVYCGSIMPLSCSDGVPFACGGCKAGYIFHLDRFWLLGADARRWRKVEDVAEWFSGLSPQERSFISSLIESSPGSEQRTTLEVFADWLEEQGRQAESVSIRRLSPKDGDVILFSPRKDDAFSLNEWKLLQGVVRKLSRDLKKHHGIRVNCAATWNRPAVEHLDEKQLVEAGLVRQEDVHRICRLAHDASEMAMLERCAEYIRRAVNDDVAAALIHAMTRDPHNV